MLGYDNYERAHCADCERLRKVEEGDVCEYHRKKKVTKIEDKHIRRVYWSSVERVIRLRVNREKERAERTAKDYKRIAEASDSRAKRIERMINKDVLVLKNRQYDNVNKAVEFVNKRLFNSDDLFHDFLSQIQEKKSFDMADVDGDYIARKLIEFKHSGRQLEVVIYRSRNPWSKAYGYWSPSTPFKIYVNSRKIPGRTAGSLVTTFTHEPVHAIDGLDTTASFGHGDNSSVGKDDTAPYWIGNLAGRMYDGTDITEADYPRTVRSSWYKRLWRWFTRL